MAQNQLLESHALRERDIEIHIPEHLQYLDPDGDDSTTYPEATRDGSSLGYNSMEEPSGLGSS